MDKIESVNPSVSDNRGAPAARPSLRSAIPVVRMAKFGVNWPHDPLVRRLWHPLVLNLWGDGTSV